MKGQTFIKKWIAGVVMLMILVTMNTCSRNAELALEEGFQNPPSSAKPHNWWHWMNGNITKEGITMDLEAMARVGIGGFQIFQVGTGIPKGPIDYGSEEHTELLKWAAAEADRLGLEFSMHNCPGWSSSGGPWITPEYSMQQLVWSETSISGGETVNVMLPQPNENMGYYRDALVLAFPSLDGEGQSIGDLLSRVTSSSGVVDVALLIDGDPTGGVEVRSANASISPYLQFEFTDPFEARSISVTSSPLPGAGQEGGFGRGGVRITLEASDNGAQFREVGVLASAGGRGTLNPPATAAFPAVQAKYYRLVLPASLLVSEVQLSGTARIADWPRKANFGGGGFGGSAEPMAETGEIPSGQIIDPASVVDISQYMDSEGRLNWSAPAGNWTILRLGHTTIGVMNHPAPDGGEGLECDKFSQEAMDFHFEHFFGELLPALKSLADKGMAGSIIDSYEVGMQNWTTKFPEEFEERCGYDLWQYLPAMTGRVVGSADISDRFLWDVRRTQADMMADYYFGRFREMCNKYGLKGYAEPYSGGPFEEMQAGSRMDMVMGEFWQGRENHRSVKLAASIAHVNGIGVVGAESFTSRAKWMSYPYALKALGDFVYTQGLSRYIFHTYAHQPHPTAIPSMTMGPWGWHFNRPNTWFNQSPTWLEYIARCQFMLQQGLFVGDLAYLMTENAPRSTPGKENLEPGVPDGYDFDTINSEAVLRRAKVKNKQLVLPDGMSYRLLILPEQTTMTLDLLSKIRDMVNQGLWIVGPKPEHSPSLAGYPSSEEDVSHIAEEVWGNLNGITVTERAFGKGRVFWGAPLSAVLAKLDLKPDFQFTSRSGEADINTIHRQVDDVDFYFVANRGEQSEDLVCTFRIEGKQPEFWDAVNGKMSSADVYELMNGGIRLPVRLDAAGSIFVVFRSVLPAQHLETILKDGVTIAGTEPFPSKEIAPEAEPEVLSMGFGRFQQTKFPMPSLEEPPAIQMAGGQGGELLIWKNGNYALQDNEGQTSQVEVSGIGRPVELTGSWQVSFPPNLGAPSEIRLNRLISLAEHPNNGVKYFSGTATYTKSFNVSADALADGKRLYLDLGHVEVVAEVIVNGQNLGVLWMPPFRVDITDVVSVGDNDLEIRVTNLWPNRLIGDDRLFPAESEYAEDGAILELPDWYLQGQPKPAGGRITFTTWKHWSADDELLESGLIGPVLLRSAVQHAL